MAAAGGAFSGDPLDVDQANAVVRVLKQLKGAEPGTVTIGVKARLAGSIVTQLGEVPAGAERIGDVLSALDSLSFN